MASMVTLAIMSLSPPSGLNQPMSRQNSRDSPARVGCGIDSDQCAQQRHFPGGEVAAVIAALDPAGHAAAMKARLRSSLIDHGSHGDRSSGARPAFFAHASSHASASAERPCRSRRACRRPSTSRP